MSQLTTHILDTTVGKPAADVSITLYHQDVDSWREIAKGVTNKDGRVADLLQKEALLEHGVYKLRFDTKPYFDKLNTRTFYPFVEITFEITTNDHYHVPLLLNPFGFSTYRGS
jgi:5-hydroxyisourate hydrolase